MRDFTKKARYQIRQLASLLYERELNEELSKLDAHFDAWRKGVISPFELTEQIHHFHQKPARELYNRFEYNDMLHLVVAQGIVAGTIKPDEVPPEAREAMATALALFQSEM